MNTRFLGAVLLTAIVVPVVVVSLQAQDESAATTQPMTSLAPMAACPNCSTMLPRVRQQIRDIRGDIASGKTESANYRLDQLQKMIETCSRSCASRPTTMPAGLAKVVNSICPIMEQTVDPYKVNDMLIREFKGQKVGFCCPSCLKEWDKLTDEQKQQRLDRAMKK